MEFPQLITVLILAVALASIDPSACQTVKGKVSCTDCTQNYDFSGIMISVKCEGVKNLAVATTEDNGSFKVDLPCDLAKTPPVNCFVKLLGSPSHLYATRKSEVSQIVKGKDKNSYTISTPLSFFTSCSQNTECKAANLFGSSKTVDLPLPRQWGLAPSSYYFPVLPIIGVP